ncbi:hypothetical protein LXL04_006509 [Taraxacum kok-saghyz]
MTLSKSILIIDITLFRLNILDTRPAALVNFSVVLQLSISLSKPLNLRVVASQITGAQPTGFTNHSPQEKSVVCFLIHSLIHSLIELEQNKAQLVIIAHDVDPIELVVWLPALCRKMEIPYCIVKGKSRLGTIVHQKTAAALCLTTVKNEDKMEFSRILEAIKANFNDKYEEYKKKWGGGIMGSKSQAKTKAKERVLAKEAAQRLT